MNPKMHDWQGVIDRLEKLERQNRTLKKLGLAALLAAGAVVLMGQAASKQTVEANGFVLKDSGGKVRAVLDTRIGGEPELALMDEKGQRRIWLHTVASTPVIELLDHKGEHRLELTIGSIGTPPGSRFVEDGWAGLSLSDPKGYMRASLVASEDGQYLTFFDPTENSNSQRQYPLRERFQVSSDATGPAVFLKDKEGFETTIGTTDLVTPRTGETHKTSAASVVLFDKDEKVLWKAP